VLPGFTDSTQQLCLRLRGNCLAGNAKADAQGTRYDVDADGNWWGASQPRTEGSVTTARPLADRPACGPRPPAAAAVGGPTGLRFRVQRRAPYRFTTSGTVIPPAGVSPTAACRGVVTVQVKAGRSTISTRRARVSPACAFRSQVSFRGRRRFRGRRALRFFVRFDGNAVLARRRAAPRSVSVR